MLIKSLDNQSYQKYNIHSVNIRYVSVYRNKAKYTIFIKYEKNIRITNILTVIIDKNC